MMRRIGGVLLTATGFLACPCHLIVTLPLLASVLAGTALGGFLTHNSGLVIAFASIYFVVALLWGCQLLFSSPHRTSKMDITCPTCVPAEPEDLSQVQPLTSDELPTTRRVL